MKDGKPIGSALIGQLFKSDGYFHGRPSATSDTDPNDSSKTIDAPYNAANSSGSNFGPTNAKLIARVKDSVVAWRKDAGDGPVPADAVTTSASGLDPDVSPANALGQVARVAKARSLSADQVKGLVEKAVAGPLLGVIGEPRVNVLQPIWRWMFWRMGIRRMRRQSEQRGYAAATSVMAKSSPLYSNGSPAC